MLIEFFLGNKQELEQISIAEELKRKPSHTNNQRRKIVEADKISRRLFLRRAGVSGFALAALPAVPFWLFRRDPPSLPEQTFPEVLEYYPEIATLQPQEKGSLRTNGGRLITWINATDLRIDQPALKDLYSAVELIADRRLEGIFNDRFGNTRNYWTSAMVGRRLLVFIIPADGPTGETWGNSKLDGATFISYQRNDNVSFVRLRDPASLHPMEREHEGDEIGNANFALAIEAAQSLINAHTGVNSEPVFGIDREVKEWLNNSIGSLANYKFKGVNYEEYASSGTITLEIEGVGITDLLKFPESIYNLIPILAPPIKRQLD